MTARVVAGSPAIEARLTRGSRRTPKSAKYLTKYFNSLSALSNDRGRRALRILQLRLSLADRLGGIGGYGGDLIEQQRYLLENRAIVFALGDLVEFREKAELARDGIAMATCLLQPATQPPTAFERSKAIKRAIERRPALAIQRNIREDTAESVDSTAGLCHLNRFSHADAPEKHKSKRLGQSQLCAKANCR